ncbi:MAG: fused MFS/spermidine synthase, partial [Acidimicrobiia bacterium]|nr:fused MFS/spermidine synthase [Acidimicrobiia bacterium]
MSHKVAGTIVFLTSGAVLVLEILAGRLLAPYFGVTLETFTAIIGVVLAGIAAGTWGGGRFADSRRSPHQMIAPMLIAGGVLGAFAVPVVRAAGPALAPAGIAGLVVLTAAALLPSTAILSAVSPVVVKTVLADLADTGSVVGR